MPGTREAPRCQSCGHYESEHRLMECQHWTTRRWTTTDDEGVVTEHVDQSVCACPYYR